MRHFLLHRFRPHTVGIATALTFLTIQSLYMRASPGHHVDWPAMAAATVTFVLLFVQLRLVDDIDDFQRDVGTGGNRTGLLVGLSVVIAATVLLTVGHWRALLVVLAATTAMLVAPVIARHPRLPAQRLLLPIVCEGAPALIMGYAYVAWRTYGATAAPPSLVLGVTGLFWAAYEFWKFSRKLDQEDYRPYGLGLRGRFTILAILLATVECCIALAFSSRSLPPIVLVYGALVPLAFAGWLAWWWIGAARSGPRATGRGNPAWAGLTFAFVLELGLLAAAVA